MQLTISNLQRAIDWRLAIGDGIAMQHTGSSKIATFLQFANRESLIVDRRSVC